jgi:Zn-dependent protease with chaperone function
VGSDVTEPTLEPQAGAQAPVATPPLAEPTDAVYFDGTSNRKRRVTLRLAGELEISEDGNVVASWHFPDIRRVDGTPGTLRLGCTSALPLARLEIADGAIAADVTARCPSLDVGSGGSTSAWRIVFWSVAAACSIVGLAVFGIPMIADRLAPIVPASVDNRLGAAFDGQIRSMLNAKTCDNAEGRAAFTILVDKIKQAGNLEGPVEAVVLSSTMVNAFALPGGRIYMLDGLIKRADTADELAGVIAHELGHVRNRDSLRKIIQNGGTSFLIGLLFGDVMGGSAIIFASRTLIDTSYSRDAERGADAFTIEAMQKLGRSARPMGELLFRVTGAQKNGLTIVASHPLTEERLDVMRKAERERPITGAELLTPEQWKALKAICSSTR